MVDLLVALSKTPLPIVLAIGGLVFLFLGIAGSIKQLQIEPLPKTGRMWAGIVGMILLVLAITLYIVPAIQEVSGVATATPTVTEAALGVTSDPVVIATEEATATTAVSLNGQGYEQIVDTHGHSMVLIPAGSFIMGSDTTFLDESPPRRVTITKDYWMDVFEVSNKQYKSCVDAGICDAPRELSTASRRPYYGNTDFENYPIIYITWDMANTFCTTWRGGRLPTEAEWEYAAHGSDQRSYPWGNSEPTCDLSNFEISEDSPCVIDGAPVDSYPRGVSPFGVFNMAGNVWEWVIDWYGTYEGAPEFDPTGIAQGLERVLRGGSWRSNPESIRATVRYSSLPDEYGDNIGVRCVNPSE